MNDESEQARRYCRWTLLLDGSPNLERNFFSDDAGEVIQETCKEVYLAAQRAENPDLPRDWWESLSGCHQGVGEFSLLLAGLKAHPQISLHKDEREIWERIEELSLAKKAEKAKEALLIWVLS